MFCWWTQGNPNEKQNLLHPSKKRSQLCWLVVLRNAKFWTSSSRRNYRFAVRTKNVKRKVPKSTEACFSWKNHNFHEERMTITNPFKVGFSVQRLKKCFFSLNEDKLKAQNYNVLQNVTLSKDVPHTGKTTIPNVPEQCEENKINKSTPPAIVLWHIAKISNLCLEYIRALSACSFTGTNTWFFSRFHEASCPSSNDVNLLQQNSKQIFPAVLLWSSVSSAECWKQIPRFHWDEKLLGICLPQASQLGIQIKQIFKLGQEPKMRLDAFRGFVQPM